jgi:DNA-binding transcriptional MerR regulator
VLDREVRGEPDGMRREAEFDVQFADRRGIVGPGVTRTDRGEGMAQRGSDGAMDFESARAALEASDKLYYRIGEVSKLTGVKAHVLRYWETEFRWMAPPKSRSKQRLYRKRDIEFVWLLKHLLWNERYTIAGARRRIQELGVEDALELLRSTGGRDGALASGEPGKAAGGADAPGWGTIHAALEEMREELVSLRGTLQEGA